MSRGTSVGLRAVRLGLCAIGILWYFLRFAGAGVSAFFSTDDLMNLSGYLETPFGDLLRANFTFWSGAYRPLGGIFYRSVFALAGFQPVVFHLICFALLLLNMYLVFRIAVALAGSHEIALLTTLIFAYHPNLSDLYFSVGTIYDILCFTFYCLAFLTYLNSGRWLAFCALFTLALNAKEMAISLPLVLATHDIIFSNRLLTSRRRRYAYIASAFFIAAVFGAAKMLAKNPFTGQPAYTPVLTVSRYLLTANAYMGEVFYHRPWFTSMRTILIYIAAISLGLVMRRRVMVFAALFLLLTALPVAFIPPRGGYVLYIPMVGWALYAATLVSSLRRRFLTRAFIRGLASTSLKARKRASLAIQFAVFILCTVLLIKIHRSGHRGVNSSDIGANRTLRSAFAQISKMYPVLPRDTSILFLNDPFPRNDFTMLYLIQLGYNDHSLAVIRKKNFAPGWHENYSDYDLIFEFADGRFQEIYSRLGQR